MATLKYTGDAGARWGDRLLKNGDTFECSAADAEALCARPDFEEAGKPKNTTKAKPKGSDKKGK